MATLLYEQASQNDFNVNSFSETDQLRNTEDPSDVPFPLREPSLDDPRGYSITALKAAIQQQQPTKLPQLLICIGTDILVLDYELYSNDSKDNNLNKTAIDDLAASRAATSMNRLTF